ncbi:hypothetical protein Efla_006112 [Eimeria flavescens]
MDFLRITPPGSFLIRIHRGMMTEQAEAPIADAGDAASGGKASSYDPPRQPAAPAESVSAEEDKQPETSSSPEGKGHDGRLSLGAPLKQRVAVRFMQGRRGVQEDRHFVASDLKKLAESAAQREGMDSWGVSPTALVALFDGHRGVLCSDFCSSAFPAKLKELLCRKLPDQIAAKQGAGRAGDSPADGRQEEQQQPARRDSTGSEVAEDGGPPPLPIPLSQTSFTSPAPKEPLLEACCCPAVRALLPALPPGLQQLMPSLFHRLFSTFKQTDKEFLAKYKVKATAGCTAVALLTLGRLGVVCWVGDSRAVAGVQRPPRQRSPASPGGQSQPADGKEGAEQLVAVRLTEDHKPNRADEKARIEKAGGHVVVVGGVARVAPSDYQAGLSSSS